MFADPSVARIDVRSVTRTGRSRARGSGLLVAIIVVLGACTSDEPISTEADYSTSMERICESTDARLESVGQPPDDIGPVDWATEVSLAFRGESEATGSLTVTGESGEQHRNFVTTTADLATRYEQLADALATGSDITAINTEITELSLGRDDLALELGISACARSTS